MITEATIAEGNVAHPVLDPSLSFPTLRAGDPQLGWEAWLDGPSLFAPRALSQDAVCHPVVAQCFKTPSDEGP